MPETLDPAVPPPAAQPPIPTSAPVAPDQSSPIDDAFSTLDGFGSESDEDQEIKRPVPKPREEKPAAKPEPAPKQKAAPVEEKKAEKTVEKPADKPLPAPELRKAYERLKAEHNALKAEREAEKAKASEPKPEDPAAKEYTEKLTAYEKQIEAERKRAKDLDDKIRQIAYEHSDEYKTQYVQPIIDAVKLGQKAVTGMVYSDSEGNTRAATAEDFNEVLSATDFTKARQIAKARFPEDAMEVMSLWKDVMKEVGRKDEALVKWQNEAGIRDQQRVAQEKTVSESRNKIWEVSNRAAEEKYPQFFKPIEGDDEGNSILAQGFNRARAVFNGGKMLDDNGNEITLSDEDMVKLHSEAYMKIAGFNRLARSNRMMQKQIDELKAKIDGYEKSAPKGGDGAAQPAKPEKTWEDDLMAMGENVM